MLTKRLLTALALGLAMTLPAPALAVVESIDIERRETVADGKPFGAAGAYEKLVGTVSYAIDPDAGINADIVDLDKAPTGDDGKVHFKADFYLLQPKKPGRGNGSVLLEVPNRGGKAAIPYLHRGAEWTLDPTETADFGDGLLMRQGFTMAWVGWQADLPDEEGLIGRSPVYASATEEPVEGLVRADKVYKEPANVLPLGHRDHRAYAVANPDDSRNQLTVRDDRLAERRVIPRDQWRFTKLDDGEVIEDRRHIYYDKGFKPGKIYEAVYVAQKPEIAGLGLASVRDFATFLKHGEASPVRIERVLALGISQTGRYLRHFLYQGFNRPAKGERALDGVLAHTAGGGRGSFNHRFAQPSRDAHPYSAFFYPTDIFPFSGKTQSDPVSGLRDGLLKELGDSEAMPKVFFTNTGYEYWGRAASLIHTAVGTDNDVQPLPPVRIYHVASAQHFVDDFPPKPDDTAYPANPADFLWVLRSLVLRLNSWVAAGESPPPSRYPEIADDTLVEPEQLDFPDIPEVRVPEEPHAAYRMDYGGRFRSEGVVTKQPPVVGEPFTVRVAQVDDTGNELGGIRLPEIEVPLATYTPWNWRAESIGAPDELADFRGSFLRLPCTPAARKQAGDPRRSIAARYADGDAYQRAYTHAALTLINEGYLLARDLPGLLARADRLWETIAVGACPSLANDGG